MYQWGENTADRIWLGTGIGVGSFTFHYLKEGKTISVFSVYTSGKFTLNYGWLSSVLSQETMQEFHSRITEIPTFKRVSADFSKWPSLLIKDAFKSSEELAKFKRVVEWLREKIELVQ